MGGRASPAKKETPNFLLEKRKFDKENQYQWPSAIGNDLQGWAKHSETQQEAQKRKKRQDPAFAIHPFLC